MGAIGVELREVTPVHPDNEVGGCTRPLVETAPEESPAEDTGKAVSAKVTKVKPTRNCKKKKCPKAEETAVLISQVVVSGEDTLGDTAIAAEETKIRPEKPIYVPGTGTEPIENVVTPDYKGDGSDEPKEAVDSEYERVIPVCPHRPIPEPLFVSIVDRVWVSLQNNTDKPDVLINLAHIPDIPYSKVLDTPDLSQFITRSVNDLVYYYTKNETYTKAEVNALIQDIPGTEYARDLLDADDLFFKLPDDEGQDVIIDDPGTTGIVMWGAESANQVALDVNGTSKFLLKPAAIDGITSSISILAGYFSNGAARNALLLNGHNDEYFATASALATKQDTIADLAAIRAGAALGATAVQTEVDPTVPSWAKNQTLQVADVPTLTTAKISDIETWISGKGYITKAVNDLTNYYTKSQTYTQAEVDALIGSITQFHFEIYPTLPATGQSNVLYLIGPQAGTDIYDEYVYSNNAWTKIGSTSIDLSAYVQKTTQVIAGTGLVGGGALSSDVTLNLSSATIASLALADSAYQLPSSGIPLTDLASGVQASLASADSAYQKPSTGIPLGDLHDDVQSSLALADTALQSTDLDGYVNAVSPSGTGNYVTSVSKSGKVVTVTYGNVAFADVTGAEDLQAIEAITGTSGLLKKTAVNTWALDTNTYALASDLAAVSGRVTTLEGRTNWDQYFGIDANGHVFVRQIDENTPRNFYSYGAVTAYGANAGGGGGGGIDLARVWESLSTNTDSFGAVTIHPDHIPNIALSTITGADDLKAIEALTGTSGLLRKTAANMWTLDTAAYLTQNETITLSGDVTGSGRTSITTTIGEGRVTNAMLAGGITNAKLVNSGVTIGSATVALGGTKTLTEIGIPTWAQASSLAFSSLPAMYIGNARVQGSAQTAQDVGGIGNLTAQRLYLADGVYLYYDSENEGIKVVGAGLYSESYLTAYGVNGSGGGGGGGIDLARVWQSLTTNTDAFGSSIIHSDHIPDYDRLSFVNLNEGTDVTIYVDPGVTGTVLWGAEDANQVTLSVNGMDKALLKPNSIAGIKSSISTLSGNISALNVRVNGLVTGVSSVAGKSGAVSLVIADIEGLTSALASKLEVAVTSLGGSTGAITLGSGLTISGNQLSVTGQTQGTVTRVDVGSSQYSPDANGVVGLPAYPTTLPASDVYSWAKQATKPSYNFSEIGNTPDSLAGYGIGDAYIEDGTIHLGGSSISPLTSHQAIYAFTIKDYSEATQLTYTPNSAAGSITLTKSIVGLSNVTNDAQVKRTEMGAALGVATLGSDGKIPSSQLPSYVDDVLEYASTSAFPASGESGKIYVALDTNKTYRWSGTTYTEISPSIVIGTTTGTAFDGGSGYAHVNNTNNPHSVTKAQVGLGSVDNLAASGYFTLLENDNNQISVTIGGTNKKLTVAYAGLAGNASLLENHAASYFATASGLSSVADRVTTLEGWKDTWDDIFGIDGNGDVYVKANGNTPRNFYSLGGVSAYGTNSGGGGGSTIDLERVWMSLANSASFSNPGSTAKIHTNHLPTLVANNGLTAVWASSNSGTDGSTLSTTLTLGIDSIAMEKVNGLSQALDGKQAVISDLSTIRSNASDGETAYGWGNHANAGYMLASNFTQANIQSTLGISNWALEANKPSYTFSEIGSTPTSIDGYGIDDAYIEDHDIHLGNGSITVLAADTVYNLVVKNSAGTTVLTYNPANISGGELTLNAAMVGVSLGTAGSDYRPLTVGSTTQNFLTAHQSLANYYTKTEVDVQTLSLSQGVAASSARLQSIEDWLREKEWDKDFDWAYIRASQTYDTTDIIIP